MPMLRDITANLPQHIAIIMDGNNRWAKSKGLSATAGHRAGSVAAREIVDSCVIRNIKFLTLFAFSSENWLRPVKEVHGLMALFLSVLKRNEINQLHSRNVRLQFIGNRDSFSKKLRDSMRDVEQLTAANTGTTVTVAADYGGHWDIVNAAQKIAQQVADNKLTPDQITAELMQENICLGKSPMPDLCIRTGGEHRISNFLMWQLAYTELYFTECFWPDFDDSQLQLALDDFATRQRRFGKHLEADQADMSRA
jgi:undecaprenyl diphosphate synthase